MITEVINEKNQKEIYIKVRSENEIMEELFGAAYNFKELSRHDRILFSNTYIEEMKPELDFLSNISAFWKDKSIDKNDCLYGYFKEGIYVPNILHLDEETRNNLMRGFYERGILFFQNGNMGSFYRKQYLAFPFITKIIPKNPMLSPKISKVCKHTIKFHVKAIADVYYDTHRFYFSDDMDIHVYNGLKDGDNIPQIINKLLPSDEEMFNMYHEMFAGKDGSYISDFIIKKYCKRDKIEAIINEMISNHTIGSGINDIVVPSLIEVITHGNKEFVRNKLIKPERKPMSEDDIMIDDSFASDNGKYKFLSNIDVYLPLNVYVKDKLRNGSTVDILTKYKNDILGVVISAINKNYAFKTTYGNINAFRLNKVSFDKDKNLIYSFELKEPVVNV